LSKAVIFNVMRYSIHDGPGIRTSVFFKGCPLSCKWCHNPEGIEPKPQQSFNPQKCINCGQCQKNLTAKPHIEEEQNYFSNDCPTGARETIGYEITAAQLMNEIKKDALFYEQPNTARGGVTFSGGEPFFQAEFLLEMLDLCKREYIQTAVDTCGFCDTQTLLDAAKITDYFLYDIKFFNAENHEKYCGASNVLILENLKKLSQEKTKILIRIPVIPLINDSIQEMTAVFDYIKDFSNIETVHLLPYHNIHSDKYKRLGKQYELPEIPAGESQNMNAIADIFSSRFRAKVGG